MDGESQNLRNNRKEKYDPLYGRFVRDMKVTDIVNLYAKAAATSSDTITWDMATYTTDANHAVYPYIFGVHVCGVSTCAQISILNGTDTVMTLMPGPYGSDDIVTGCECPFTRIGPSDTLTIHARFMTSTTDTICAWLVAKREPIVSIVEN